jgi:hypothetical protein
MVAMVRAVGGSGRNQLGDGERTFGAALDEGEVPHAAAAPEPSDEHPRGAPAAGPAPRANELEAACNAEEARDPLLVGDEWDALPTSALGEVPAMAPAGRKLISSTTVMAMAAATIHAANLVGSPDP